MATISLKNDLHEMIEGIQNNEYLQDLYDSISIYLHKKGDVLDDLSPAQLQRLDESIEQANNRNVTAHDVVKTKYQQWFTK